MNTKLNVVIALIAGLPGGLVTRYIAPPVAFAQDQASVTKEIRAQSFTLVDSSDHTIGTFTAEPIPGSEVTGRPDPLAPMFPNGPQQGAPPMQMASPQMRIVLRDSNGRQIWTPGIGVRILPAVSAK